MTKPVNVGMIGYGFMGRAHSNAYAKVNHFFDLPYRPVLKAVCARSLDKVVWNYPGALFLSAGGYHHHLGTNTWAAAAPVASENDARLLEWEIVLPDTESVRAAAASLERARFTVTRDGDDVLVRDPWDTPLRLMARA